MAANKRDANNANKDEGSTGAPADTTSVGGPSPSELAPPTEGVAAGSASRPIAPQKYHDFKKYMPEATFTGKTLDADSLDELLALKYAIAAPYIILKATPEMHKAGIRLRHLRLHREMTLEITNKEHTTENDYVAIIEKWHAEADFDDLSTARLQIVFSGICKVWLSGSTKKVLLAARPIDANDVPPLILRRRCPAVPLLVPAIKRAVAESIRTSWSLSLISVLSCAPSFFV